MLSAGTFLVFELAAARYAVPLTDVQEVTRAASIMPLPGAPEVTEGILDVRGEILPVFGLRRRFRLPARPLDPDERFVVVRAGGRRAVLRVDAVEWTTELQVDRIDDLKELSLQETHFTGAGRLEDGLVLIHDLAAFLSAAEAEALDRALAAAEART